MSEPNFSINFSARMLAAQACAIGNLLVFDAAAGTWKVSTTANRATAAALSQAVALSAYGGSLVGQVSYQSSGVVAQEISGLPPGYGSRVLVRTSATGTFERIASFTSGDDVVGYAESDGRVHLHLGLPWQDILAIASFPIEVPGTPGHMIVYASDGQSGQDGGAPPTPGETNTTSNSGTGAGLVAQAKSGVNFPFRSIKAGAGILVTNNANDITIDEQRVQIANASVGTLNNVATTNGSGTEAVVIAFNGSGIATVTGLTAGREGRLVLLLPATVDTGVSIPHEDAGSTAANRFHLPGGTHDPLSVPGGGALVYYDTSISRWRVSGLMSPDGSANDVVGITSAGVFTSLGPLPVVPTVSHGSSLAIVMSTSSTYTPTDDATLEVDSLYLSGASTNSTLVLPATANRGWDIFNDTGGAVVTSPDAVVIPMGEGRRIRYLGGHYRNVSGP